MAKRKKKKLTDDVRERALALLATGMSQNQTAKKLGISPSTVNKWYHETPDALESLRMQKKTEFINDAWEIIRLATNRVRETIGEASAKQAATIAGIYYDKQALASGDNTQNIGGDLKIKVKLPDDLDGDS